MPRRLAGNLRLANELAAGRRAIWRQAPDASNLGITIPVDPQKITALFALVARGLAWFHSKTHLAPEHDADALMLTPFGQQYFDRLFAMTPVTTGNAGRSTGRRFFSKVRGSSTCRSEQRPCIVSRRDHP